MVELSVVVGVVGYGVMMPVDAAKKLVRSPLATVVACDVRSDSVRAIKVTLRSIAIADENSTVPNSITIMTGRMNANSTAARPRRSARRPGIARVNRDHIFDRIDLSSTF